jgi:dipeptidyl aminopeptidase/acylaminoacyl peptidase
MLPELPKTGTYHGKIIFFTITEDFHYLSSLYDFNTRQTIPMHPGVMKISPDGLTYAVNEIGEDKIKFYSSDGQLIRTLPPSESLYGLDHWWTPDHWLNNKQITLSLVEPRGNNLKYPIDQVIYDPFSSERKLMISDLYPDIDNVNRRFLIEGDSTIQYDPQVTRVVYTAGIEKDYLGKSGMGYVLWDLEKKEKVVEIVADDFTVTPKWAPDGSRFVINDAYGDGEFYAVTRDGAVTQLSHLNSDPAAGLTGNRYFSDLYSWSPDGRYLAFWLESETSTPSSSFQGTFAILDTQTGKVTDTCIPARPIGKNYQIFPIYSPTWSPDGKFIVTRANLKEDGSYQTVLIDLDGKSAAAIAENVTPAGWLVDKGK